MSNNLTTLLTIAAELRSGGLPWERVAEHVNRRPGTCAKWPARYKREWDRLYREAQQQRFEDAGNEGLTYLRNWMRGKEARWSLKAIEILFKSGPRSQAESAPEAEKPLDFIDQKLACVSKDMHNERDRLDRIRAHEGQAPFGDQEFWDEYHRELDEIIAESVERERKFAESGAREEPLPEAGRGEEACFVSGEAERQRSAAREEPLPPPLPVARSTGPTAWSTECCSLRWR